VKHGHDHRLIRARPLSTSPRFPDLRLAECACGDQATAEGPREAARWMMLHRRHPTLSPAELATRAARGELPS
jgi:hypothetical protein